MKQPIVWHRRRFLQLVGSASVWGAAGSRFGWTSSFRAPVRRAKFAYIGAEHGIHVYSIAADDRFIQQQTISSAHPTAMAINDGNLYVANAVSEYGNLPRGSVEGYVIDAVTGRLEFRNRLPLSLSGILPRDLAIAPDGRSVVVAVHGGGAYNVLSVDEEGRLVKVTGILKETGSGPHVLQAAAHPCAVMFDRAGRVLAADQGSDTLSVFSLSYGNLSVAGRCEVPAGSGPSSMVLHPDGDRLYVANALNGSLSTFAYDATGILDCRQTVWATGGGGELAALAMHPSGERLYSSHGDGVQVWKIAANGGLEAVTGVGIRAVRLHVMADGKSLLALSSDAVLSMKIDAATGTLAAPVLVTSLSRAASIAIF
jgi:6-phosphogluconolactonase (cycloisomerase 2 family)